MTNKNLRLAPQLKSPFSLVCYRTW